MKMIETRRWQRCALLLATSMIALSASQTMAALSVTNGNFAADAAQTSDVTLWYDTVTANTANWWESTWAGPNVSPNGTSVLGLSYMFTTTNWAYQSIGTNDGDLDSIVVNYDVGSFTDAGSARDLGVRISVYESDGSFVPSNNVDIATNVSATLIDTVTVLHTGVAPGTMLAGQAVTIDLTAASTTGELFLRINNYPGSTGEPWTAIDNISLTESLPPFQPLQVSPSGTVPTNPVTLEVTIANLGSELDSAELYFNGQLLTSGVSTNPVGSSTNVVSYTVPSNLVADVTYTGKVVVLGKNPVAGPITNEWTFTMGPALSIISTSPTGAGVEATPDLAVIIANGVSELDTGASLQMSLDGTNLAVTITPDTPVTGQTTIQASPGLFLSAGSTHTGQVVYAGINPGAGPFTNTWTFSVEGDPGYGVYIGDTNAPTPGADDVYQFAEPGTDFDNIGGDTNQNDSAYNDASTYVAFDKDLHQGQLFTTPGSSATYELSSVWMQHVNYTNVVPNGTYYNLVLADADKVVLRVVDPSVSGSGFVLHSETLQVVSNSISGGGGGGTGSWIEFRLQTPVVLDGNTQYGFDLMIEADVTAYFEWAGVQTNVYAGGDAYTAAPRGAESTTTVHAGNDRTFLVDLAPFTGGPTVTPNITGISVSGGSATLTWDSESGVNYGVLSKSALSGGSWTEVTNVAGAEGSTMATVPAASDEEFFSIEGN